MGAAQEKPQVLNVKRPPQWRPFFVASEWAHRGQARSQRIWFARNYVNDTNPCGSGLARDGSDTVLDQVRIPRPLTSNRAQPKYSTTVATSMKLMAMPMRMSDTPRMP